MTLPTEHLFADTGENSSIALLKQHFPQCFDKDGLFLPDKLAEQLQTANVPVSREYYTMNWLGKSATVRPSHCSVKTPLTIRNLKTNTAKTYSLKAII